MKIKRIIAVISLLLALIMALCACQGAGAGAGGFREDTPVSADAIFSNFVKVEEPTNTILNDSELVSDTYGQIFDVSGDIAIFGKQVKDKLNNAIQTVTLYSVSEKKAIGEIKNIFVADYGWDNDFGHEVLVEKLITDAYIGEFTSGINDHEINYFVVVWEINTPIGDETVENDDLAVSYKNEIRYDFYDVTGAFIASSSKVNSGEYVDSNDNYTLLSFGKTVAMFDENGKMVKSYNGDVESTPILYTYMNERYNYLIVPNGITDDSQVMTRFAVEVYDKEGELVCRYNHGDYASYATAIPLEGGDVIIQQLVYTEDIESDYQGMNVDTFLLDVESGKVKELTEFNYLIFGRDITYADDFADSITEGFVATENVRNVISGAINLETKKDSTIFFDNFGNINFEFDYIINREMAEGDNVITVLDSNHILVEISSEVTSRAIINARGDFVAYVPDGAKVFDNCVLYDDCLYNFDMNKIRDVYDGTLNSFERGEMAKVGEFGDNIIFTGVNSSNEPYVVIYNVLSDYSDSYYNTEIVFQSDNDDMVCVVLKSVEDYGMVNYKVINGIGNTVFSISCTSGTGFHVYSADNAIFVEVGYENVYLISEAEYDGYMN